VHDEQAERGTAERSLLQFRDRLRIPWVFQVVVRFLAAWSFLAGLP